MPRYGYSASSSRRVPKVESESESDDGYDYDTMNSNAQRQAEIMMKDLGSDTRNFITTNDRGRQPDIIPASALQRDCNQKGSQAALLAVKNQSKLQAWSDYHSTSDAKAAGGETLDGLNGGNSHRLRVRSELQDKGISCLEDTYYNPRSRGGPPFNKPGRGAAAAVANDRGHFSHARGGGFAGRGMGRGGMSHSSNGVSRSLDPAVDPDRVYSCNPSRKRATDISMNQGKVTMKPTANSTTNSKAGRVSSPRLTRSPLPVDNPYNLLADHTDSFMDATLALFKKQAESGKHILPAKAATEASTSTALLQPHSTSLPPEQPTSPDIVQSQDGKKSPEMHHINRDELGLTGKSPDAFTDGHPSQSNLSGFSLSIDSQADVPAGSTSQAGLGIQGVTVDEERQPTDSGSSELMNTETPSDMNADLLPRLKTSAPDHRFPSEKVYAEFLQYKEFIASCKSQDFEQWLAQQKSEQSAATSTSLQAQQASSVSLDISAGYKIGSGSLGCIIGDDRNVPSQAKSTQTTPSLMQSKWASPETNTLLTFKAKSGPIAQPQPSSLEPTPEVQETPRMPTQTANDASATVDPQGSLKVQPRVLNGLNGQPNDNANQQGNSRTSEPNSIKGIKPVNPFAPREKLDTDFGQSQSARRHVQATESKVAAPQAPADPDSVEINLPAQGVDQLEPSAMKSMHDSKSSAAKAKDILNTEETSRKVLEPVKRSMAKHTLSASKWSTATPSHAPVAEEIFKQEPEPGKPTTAKRHLSGSKWATTGREGADAVKDAPTDYCKPSKPPVTKQGLSGSKWSAPTAAAPTIPGPTSGFGEDQPAKSGLIIGDHKNVRRVGATVLSPLPTNALKNPSEDTDPRPVQHSSKDGLIKKPAPQAPIGAGIAQRNPFQTRADISQRNPFQARTDATGGPTATQLPMKAPTTAVFGDGKNIRKSISKGTKDAASRSATAIERQFTDVLRSTVGRGQDLLKENVRQEQNKPGHVEADREEGEIVEDNVDVLNGLADEFGNMYLTRGGQK